MYRTLMTAMVLTFSLATAAVAQNANQTASAAGQWQASKLIHMNVYNDQNEKIGDIKELMVDKSGKIDIVVIGVGGFIGIGEHDVGVEFGQLKWANAPVSTNNATNQSSSNTNVRTNTATTGSNNQRKSDQNYPDHAVLNATKDQLKGMPEFKYNK